MLFQTCFHDMQSVSVRNVSAVLHHNYNFKMYNSHSYHFFPWHCHNFYEVQFFYNAPGNYDHPDKHFPERTLQLFSPLQPHSLEDIGFEYLLLIQFSVPFLHRSVPTIPEGAQLMMGNPLLQRNGIVVPEQSALIEILKRIAGFVPVFEDQEDENLFQKRAQDIYRPLYEMRLNAAVLQLLSELIGMGALVITEGAMPLLSQSIQNVIERIIMHPEEHISLRQAADIAHLSYSDFSRNFKNKLGCGYVDFCNIVRVREAENMLIFSDQSTGEIAARLGFGSASYFNRVFMRFTGITPTEFRQKGRSAPLVPQKFS